MTLEGFTKGSSKTSSWRKFDERKVKIEVWQTTRNERFLNRSLHIWKSKTHWTSQIRKQCSLPQLAKRNHPRVRMGSVRSAGSAEGSLGRKLMCWMSLMKGRLAIEPALRLVSGVRSWLYKANERVCVNVEYRGLISTSRNQHSNWYLRLSIVRACVRLCTCMCVCVW